MGGEDGELDYVKEEKAPLAWRRSFPNRPGAAEPGTNMALCYRKVTRENVKTQVSL